MVGEAYMVKSMSVFRHSTVGVKAKYIAPAPKEKEIPEELKCPICKKLLRDAVVIPCCNKSFCDEC